MSSSTNNEFSVGNGRFAVGLLGFLLFAVACWFAFHPKSPLRPYRNYSVLFPEVGTLREGNSVQILGMKKGYVTSTTLREDGVLVLLRIEKKISVPRDSRFRVVNTGLLGQREVEIRVGQSKDFYREEDSIRGGYDQGSTRLVFMAGALLSSVDTLLTTSIGVWDSTVGNPEVQARIGNVVSGASNSLDRLDRNLVDWRDSLRVLQKEVRGVLSRIDTLKRELGPGISATAQGVKEIDASLISLSGQAASLSKQGDWLTGRLKEKQNSAGLMLNDSTFQNSAKDMVHQMREFIKELRKKGLDMNVDIF
jgi:phospholipid/cholesterol/gamma-HCH transport system substrate-binding protein